MTSVAKSVIQTAETGPPTPIQPEEAVHAVQVEQTARPEAVSPRGILLGAWALGLVLLTFVEAIYRLGLRAFETIAAGLSAPEWAVLMVVVVAFTWGEGYRALHRRFGPRLVARAFEGAERARGPLAILALPLRALTLIGEDRRAVARAWLGVALIVAAVLVVRAMPSPWRGIVDAGVSAALCFGFVSILLEARRYVRLSRTDGALVTER
jgi:hypothetical protein